MTISAPVPIRELKIPEGRPHASILILWDNHPRYAIKYYYTRIGADMHTIQSGYGQWSGSFWGVRKKFEDKISKLFNYNGRFAISVIMNTAPCLTIF